MLGKFFGRADPREAVRPLYAALIAEARAPGWYVEGRVPDTLDGRFDALAAVVSVALTRLEREAGGEAVLLTELFIDDMDGQLRELGVGDVGVGKQVGMMLGALGGRLGAYRAALTGSEPLRAALVRNLYRGTDPGAAPVAWSSARLRALGETIDRAPLDALLAGRVA